MFSSATIFAGNIFFLDQYLSTLKEKTCYNFFLLLSWIIILAGIFIIIFVISASKYVGIVNFKLIGGKCFTEVYPNLLGSTKTCLIQPNRSRTNYLQLDGKNSSVDSINNFVQPITTKLYT